MLNRFFLLLFLLGGAAAAAGAAEADPVVFLKKLLIADTDEKASALATDAGGNVTLFVQDVPVLADAEFKQHADQFIGKQITPNLLSGLEVLITQYSRAHDRLIVKVSAPVQNASNGVVRLAVTVGRYKDFQFRNNRWFSSQLLLQKLGIKSGDEVRLSTLEAAVKWANTNPFRQITVFINDLQNQPGKADLVVGVEERFPYRFTIAYDNHGNGNLGDNRYTAGVQFGNLWGRDHQGSYQYMTTDDTTLFQSHSLEYKVPLPWRHYLQLNGGYLTVNPKLEGGFTQKGKNISASVRYVIPRNYRPNRTADFTVGLDIKQGDNTVAYNNVILPINKPNDTFQLTLGYSTVSRDQRGAWVFGANVNASPGNVNSRNGNLEFSSNGRVTATYITSTFSVQRLQNLGRDWSIFSRVFVQRATGTLPGGEQMSIGGANTVRGFDEQVYSGDQGFVFTNDLQAPAIRKNLPFLKKAPPLETRFIAFYDAAQVFYKFPDSSSINLTPLASAGVGLRMSLGAGFSVIGDYGWHITQFSRLSSAYQANGTNNRGHIKVVLAY